MFWNRYVVDTICFVRNGYQVYILSSLNSFHKSIQFTYDNEKESNLSIHDILIMRCEMISRRVYCKPINTYFYIQQNSFVPPTLKRSTPKTLFLRAYTICSNEKDSALELKYFR